MDFVPQNGVRRWRGIAYRIELIQRPAYPVGGATVTASGVYYCKPVSGNSVASTARVFTLHTACHSANASGVPPHPRTLRAMRARTTAHARAVSLPGCSPFHVGRRDGAPLWSAGQLERSTRATKPTAPINRRSHAASIARSQRLGALLRCALILVSWSHFRGVRGSLPHPLLCLLPTDPSAHFGGFLGSSDIPDNVRHLPTISMSPRVAIRAKSAPFSAHFGGFRGLFPRKVTASQASSVTTGKKFTGLSKSSRRNFTKPERVTLRAF